ncbi:MAG: hypothetical protein N3E49_01495 [Bacteroidia bacterium]|nr:hypothetical protein [Bacteroidia bacterium]
MRFGPVRLISPSSRWHQQTVFLELEERGVEKVYLAQEEARAELSPGWVDIGTWTWQPQTAPAESIQQALERAKRGGITHVFLGGWHGWHDPALLAQIRHETQYSGVYVHLLAAWADETNRIAPIESLRAEGAFGWSLPPLRYIPWDTLDKAIPYIRYVGGPLFLLPYWEGASGETGVPETPELALSGWKGIPPYAETVAIHAIAALYRRHGGRIIVGPITTAEGAQLTQQYGIPAFTAISYVAAHAENLLGYDPVWKLHPPLRSSQDQQVLCSALEHSSILLASWDMNPPPEEKLLEWSAASVGHPTLGILAPIAASLLQRALGEQQGLSSLVKVLAELPRHLFGLGPSTVQEGYPLDFTVFRVTQRQKALPAPWSSYRTDLEVLGTIRCLADAYNLQNQML